VVLMGRNGNSCDRRVEYVRPNVWGWLPALLLCIALWAVLILLVLWLI
jgi:hypothetical protein